MVGEPVDHGKFRAFMKRSITSSLVIVAVPPSAAFISRAARSRQGNSLAGIRSESFQAFGIRPSKKRKEVGPMGPTLESSAVLVFVPEHVRTYTFIAEEN